MESTVFFLFFFFFLLPSYLCYFYYLPFYPTITLREKFLRVKFHGWLSKWWNKIWEAHYFFCNLVLGKSGNYSGWRTDFFHLFFLLLEHDPILSDLFASRIFSISFMFLPHGFRSTQFFSNLYLSFWPVPIAQWKARGRSRFNSGCDIFFFSHQGLITGLNVVRKMGYFDK